VHGAVVQLKWHMNGSPSLTWRGSGICWVTTTRLCTTGKKAAGPVDSGDRWCGASSHASRNGSGPWADERRPTSGPAPRLLIAFAGVLRVRPQTLDVGHRVACASGGLVTSVQGEGIFPPDIDRSRANSDRRSGPEQPCILAIRAPPAVDRPLRPERSRETRRRRRSTWNHRRARPCYDHSQAQDRHTAPNAHHPG